VGYYTLFAWAGGFKDEEAIPRPSGLVVEEVMVGLGRGKGTWGF
jgi:hypothetical protein